MLIARDYLTLIRMKAKTALSLESQHRTQVFEFFYGEGVVFKTLLHEMHGIVFFLSSKNY